SPHPRLPLVKHFFFPGFTAATGGLLREAGLAQQRNAWRQDGDQVWRHLGLPQARPDETNISLFCYENAALPELLRAWSVGDAPVRCLVPAGRALVQAATCLGRPSLSPGDQVARGRLTLHALPFVAQEDYDRLLWSCDLNFVRGEDSFVRAQWAARPLVWHIYPQEDDAHRRKLSAFLERYCADLPPPAAAALRVLWQNWNHGDDAAAAWPDYWRQRAALAVHAERWALELEKMPDLAGKLVKFIEQLV
ncbi:MAG TPA: elongation factor P maturation arginine rhamnosyltransferase EarP, partial [Rhodocyclaceae bacterium]|nr:elongation factor P maturation arginine rhamnosyltransferase EarP [Rhodocyclaceae bacterium]